jgi:hypothetical protein
MRPPSSEWGKLNTKQMFDESLILPTGKQYNLAYDNVPGIKLFTSATGRAAGKMNPSLSCFEMGVFLG